MEFLSYLISGISLGSVYAIIALGYTMVYGIAKMLNFAHGDVIMIGGYVSFCAMFYLGLPSIVAVLMAVVVCTVLGIVIERLAYKPLRSAPSLAVLITAIGVSYFLQNSALLIWKAAARSYPPVVTGAVKIFGGKLTVSYVSLLTIAACVVIMIGLTTFVNKSKMGKAMRACSEDKAAAQLMGINVNATISATFAIGSILPPIPRIFSAPAVSVRRSPPSPACCSARSIRRSCRRPAPCPASRPLPRRCSAASAPSPAHSSAGSCSASSRPWPRRISRRTSQTRSSLPC